MVSQSTSYQNPMAQAVMTSTFARTWVLQTINPVYGHMREFFTLIIDIELMHHSKLAATIRGWCAKVLDCDKAMPYQDNHKILITEANVHYYITLFHSCFGVLTVARYYNNLLSLIFFTALVILALIQQCLKNSPAQARARARKHVTCTHVTLQVQPQVAGAITAPLAAALIAPVVQRSSLLPLPQCR
ncbi:hypothetical protein JB92DRAFT_1145776 [Gautieria morchelliformis]|nr:hypothetical protein JB92DRAFT_1145776 [Gautieria morchelliformis]